jgi:enolase-phosphatase E1
VTVGASAASFRVVLLDIEGTTTSVAFVYGVLFPFARAHVDEYLRGSQSSGDCCRALALLRDERAAETELDGGTGRGPAAERRSALGREDAVRYVHSLMDRDRKSPGLKMLQGLIWESGYRRGELKGEVFPDVPRALERWRVAGKRIYIYSSGSVLAQQLLFSTTGAGDLTRSLSGFFDTGVGPKTSPASYRTICERIGTPPSDVLFVSDAEPELDAAQSVGMGTALSLRDSGGAPHGGRHPVIRTFDDLAD